MLEKEKSIVIITTTISICIMLLVGIDKPLEKKMVLNHETNKNQTQIQTVIDKPNDLDTKSGTLSNISEDKSENIPVEKTKKAIEVKPAETINNNESEILKPPEENLIKAEDELKTATVFKVNKNDIYGELTFFDKEKLLLISTKIKSSDYKIISDMLKSDVDGEGVLSTLKILKNRLSKKDYSKINQIFKKFINMELVDN